MALRKTTEEDMKRVLEGLRSSKKFQQKQDEKENQNEGEDILPGAAARSDDDDDDDEYNDDDGDDGNDKSKDSNAIRYPEVVFKKSPPQAGDNTTSVLRQRHFAPKTGSHKRSVNLKKPSKRSQSKNSPSKEGFLIVEFVSDMWTWLKGCIRFSRVSYPLWKWIVLIYLTVLVLSYLFAYAYHLMASALSPICSIWIIGSQLPICSWDSRATMEPLNVSKVATSQEGLTVVMDRVGENFDLARDMTGHEFAIRDLRIRVAASRLPHGRELAQELDSLIRHTKKTAKDLSRFTAKVSKSIDTVHTFDGYAIKTLETLADREKHPPTLPGQILSALSPFHAFTSTVDQTEEQVKKLFIYTADRISIKVRALLSDSYELTHDLDRISETLDRIQELTVEELGDIPREQLLSAMWTYFAQHDTYLQQKSHTNLLSDMTEFYKRSSFVLQETVAALNRIEAELGEFGDDYATPALMLQEHPLEVIVALLRKSAQRLEAGKQKLEFVEEGGAKAGRSNDDGGARGSTITVRPIPT